MGVLRAGSESPIGDKRTLMDEGEARGCIESIRMNVDRIRWLIFDLHNREGWRALGYPSWSECVTAEFDQSRGYLYRQLQAALIEAEISPGEGIGRIAEGKLRPLAELPPGDRKPAWDLAKEASGAPEPTGKQVAAVVRELAPKPKARPVTRPVETPAPDHDDADFDQGEAWEEPADPLDADEPANILADEAAIPTPRARPRGSSAGAFDPAACLESPVADVEPEDDREWLNSLPLSGRLANRPQQLFRHDALIYRKFLPVREQFREPVSLAFGNRSRKGAFGSTLARLMRAEHPRRWIACPPTSEGGCDGHGSVVGIPCPECFGRGYLLFPRGRR